MPSDDAPNIVLTNKNYVDNNFGGESVSVAEVIGGGSGTSRATLSSFVIGSWKKITFWELRLFLLY